MNLSELPIFYSKENLTTRFVDYSNVYLLPSICLFGIITSLVSILVSFKRDESNAKTLDFILINSLIDFSFLLIQSFLFIIRCGLLCPYGYTWFAKFYEIYIYLYIGYSLVSSQVFLNIYVAYDRIKMFSAKLSSQKPVSIYLAYAICAILSIIANIPNYGISRDIAPRGIYKPDPNSTYTEILYARIYRPEFQTIIMQKVLLVIGIVKEPFFFCVLCLINIWVCIRFRIYLNSRKHLTGKKFKTITAISKCFFCCC